MSIYTAYPLYRVLLRRIAVVAFGLLALPVMLFRTDCDRFYIYLHRVWLKTSDQPVWMAQSEAAAGDFFYAALRISKKNIIVRY